MTDERDARSSARPSNHRLTRRALLKLGATVGLSAVGLSSLAGCSQPSTPAATTAKPAATTTTAPATGSSMRDDIVIARPEEIQKMDASDQFNLVNYDLFLHIFDSLVEMDEKGTFLPGLAESWETSSDGLAWTFKLKQGVKFHNGDTFTSKAVKMSIERLKDTKLARSSWWGPLDKVDTPDDYTAIIRTTTPMGTMLSNLCVPTVMYSPKQMEEDGPTFFEKPVGTGPFKFVEWKKNWRSYS